MFADVERGIDGYIYMHIHQNIYLCVLSKYMHTQIYKQQN